MYDGPPGEATESAVRALNVGYGLCTGHAVLRNCQVQEEVKWEVKVQPADTHLCV